jgi:hypothetical protein
MLDPYAATVEHGKVIIANIEANLRRNRQPKPKRQTPPISLLVAIKFA